MILQVSPHLLRGPQPQFEDLEKLQARGVKWVVNLRSECTDSEVFCQRLGLHYTHYAIDDWNVPTRDQVDSFLEKLAQPEYRRGYVHCLMGVGRTGLFVSCYRVSLGMDAEEAIEISDQETRGMGMNDLQRQWIREFARSLGRRA